MLRLTIWKYNWSQGQGASATETQYPRRDHSHPTKRRKFQMTFWFDRPFKFNWMIWFFRYSSRKVDRKKANITYRSLLESHKIHDASSCLRLAETWSTLTYPAFIVRLVFHGLELYRSEGMHAITYFSESFTQPHFRLIELFSSFLKYFALPI